MLWKIRVLSFYLILSIISILFYFFICLPIHLLKSPYCIRYKIAEIFSYIFIYLAKIFCGINYKVIGQDKLPKDGKPFLALANHQSFWENLFMQLIIPKHSWIIKKELFDMPLFGWGLRTVMPIAVDRANNISVNQILKEGAKKLKQGLSIVMFPEATRIKVDRNVKFKPSAAKLAINANVPMVLIAHNAGLYWPKGFWFKKPGTITVKILEIIPTKEYIKHDARSLTEYIQERINKEKEILCNLVK